MLTVFFAAASMMAMPQALPPGAEQCQVREQQRKAMMSASYDTFDQNANSGRTWRTVFNSGCYQTASSLIAKFITLHEGSLDAEQLRTLKFHVGQCLAIGGDDEAAIPWFTRARGGTEEWDSYVAATLAFVQKDRAEFDKARARYAAVAPTSPRVAVLASFATCFSKRYSLAMSC